jgi:enoyl-CoA hydratase
MTSWPVKWAPPFRSEPVDHAEYDLIRYEVDPPLGRIVFNSPEKRNPLGYERLVQLAMAAKEMELDDSVKVIIIKGDGPCFSAGYDITPVRPGEPSRNTPADGYIHPDRDVVWGSYNGEHLRVYFTLWDLQKPVIAQIHGHCLAGATELAALCDLRVVADDAQIGWPVGRTWSPGNFQVMPWVVNVTKAKYYMFTNTPMDGREAFRCDWASAVYPAEELEARAEQLARQIAITDTDLIMLTKRSINRQLEHMGFRAAVHASGDLFTLACLRPGARRLDDEFQQIAQESGLATALAWRNRVVGIDGQP